MSEYKFAYGRPPREKPPEVESQRPRQRGDSIYDTNAKQWRTVVRGQRVLTVAGVMSLLAAALFAISLNAFSLTIDAMEDGLAPGADVQMIGILCVCLMLAARFLQLVGLFCCLQAPLPVAARRFLLACGLYCVAIVLAVFVACDIGSDERLTFVRLLIPIVLFADLGWRFFWFAGISSITSNHVGLAPPDVQSSRTVRGMAIFGLLCALVSLATFAVIVFSGNFPRLGLRPDTVVLLFVAGIAAVLADLCVLIVSFVFANLIARLLALTSKQRYKPSR